MNGDPVSRRRGFLAELQYINQQAAKSRRQQEVAAHRARVAAQREAERAQRAAQQARSAAAAADTRQRAHLAQQAQLLHVESQIAEVESRNAGLVQAREEIDGLLSASLAVDDFIDLERLKITKVEHPPFRPGQLGSPSAKVPPPIYPQEPVYQEPPSPGGLFSAKKKHAELIAQSRHEFERVHRAWHDHVNTMQSSYLMAVRIRDESESRRIQRLAVAEATYAAECRQREAEAENHNQALAKLVNDLAFDIESAIQEYVGIVLSNSVYPEAFPVEHDYEFDLATRELRLVAAVPAPSSISAVKEYKYVKTKDEITSTALPAKALKDRYTGAVTQVAVRTLHEIFEADRSAKIYSIALRVVCEAISPATGLLESVPLVIVAADREAFKRFDLSNVVPLATLQHLGAAISKSPFDLIPADTSRGTRTRKQ
jgi:restriction system protein